MCAHSIYSLAVSHAEDHKCTRLPFHLLQFAAGLRMFPPAVSGSSRKLAHPVATKRHGTLPKGTHVFVPCYAVHHSTRVRILPPVHAKFNFALLYWFLDADSCRAVSLAMHLQRSRRCRLPSNCAALMSAQRGMHLTYAPTRHRQASRCSMPGFRFACIIQRVSAGVGGRCARVAARQVAEGALGGSVQAG